MPTLKRRHRISPLLSGALAVLLAAAGSAAAEPVALVGGTLVDGTGRAPVPDAAVVIDNGRIVAVGSAAAVTIPAGARTIDLGGRTILPGLIDSHMHIGGSGGGSVDPREFTPTATENNLLSYLKFGITTVYDMAAHPGLREMKAALESGKLTGPRMFGNGYGITAPGSHPVRLLTELGVMDFLGPYYFQVDDAASARDAVRRIVAAKTDGVKLFHSRVEAATTRYDCDKMKLPAEALVAAVEEAHAHGKRVYAHISLPSEAKEAVEAGVDVLVHSIGMAETGAAEVFELMARKGSAYIPTLAIMEARYSLERPPEIAVQLERKIWPVLLDSISNPQSNVVTRRQISGLVADETRSFEIAQANLQKALKAGVTIAMGSDAGNAGMLHGATALRELQLMVKAGMTPMQAIMAATRNAARVIGQGDSLGTLEPGRIADILVVDGDPVADIDAIANVHLVVKAGEVIDPAKLQYQDVPPGGG